jgi:hypothetical protein
MAELSLSHELPQAENDLESTAIFRELRAVEPKRNALAEQREAQQAFDDVLSKLGTRAVAPRYGESNEHFLAVLATQAAAFGPEDRKRIDRQSLARSSPAALAEVARTDLEIARGEIERPHYSLRPGETRAVEKIDRSGRPVIEFFNAENSPSFWMDDFKPPLVSMVSGGSKGFATADRGGVYRFDKSNVIPELVALRQQEQYEQTAEYKIRKAYADVGLVAPDDVVRSVRK